MSFLAALAGFFKFFDEVKWFIQLLQKSPQEQHDALIKQVEKTFDEGANNGRPQW